MTTPDDVSLDQGRNLVDFCEKLLGVKLNRGQRRWIKHNVTPDGRFKVKGSIWVAANQVGKSLLLAVVILWAAIYKVGINETDGQKWLDAPYQWFHVSPTQQQAYIPLRDIELLVKGAHPAQEIGAKQYGLVFSKYITPLVSFQKVENYDGFSTLMGAEVQFRTTDDKAKALQGRRANGISFDEAAFEDHLRSVVNETLLMRLVSTNGPLLIVSTPNGINAYYEMVEELRQAGHSPVDEPFVWVTDTGWTLIWATIADNVGFGLTQEAVERMEEDLDPETKEQQLRGAFLEPREAFFVPTTEVVKAWREITPLPPMPGRKYVIFWDPSGESDPTAAYVLDCTRKPWQVVHEVYERKPGGINSLISQMFGIHRMYGADSDSWAITGFDATSLGGTYIKQLLVRLSPQKPLNFGGSGQVKLDVLTNLRALLLRGELIMPNSMAGLKSEVLSYRLDDKKLVQDRVMALAGAAWVATKSVGGSASAAFDPSARIAQPIWR